MESIFWSSSGFSHAQSYHVESPTTSSEPAWTTARCNRLLRPLSSKISLLRKSRLLDSTGRSSQERQESITSSNTQSDVADGKDDVRTLSSSLGVHGLNWDPSPRPRKKVKLKYSSRDFIRPVENDAASKYNIPSRHRGWPPETSFMGVNQSLLPSIATQEHRLRSNDADGQEEARLPPGFYDLKARSRERLFRHYVITAYPDCWKLLDGIHSGLESLLKATSKNLTGNRCGSRSLLSTCLRKTPEYIAAHEHWCRTQDPESADDVSPSIYAELENFGARSTQSSSALQEVVRAHGVNMIGSAVTDGLICFPIASRFVKLCLQLEAYNEAEHLIVCILALKTFPRPTSREDLLFVEELSILEHFAIITGRFGFLYRNLTMLFENERLPVEWISSPDMVERWNGIFQCISERHSDAKDAGNLLRTVILMSEGLFLSSTVSKVHLLRIRSIDPNDANKTRPRHNRMERIPASPIHDARTLKIGEDTSKTGLRLLAVLCALEFAQTIAVSSDVVNTSVLQNLAVEARQILESHQLLSPSVEQSGFCADVLCLILLAAGLSSHMVTQNPTNLDWYLSIFGCKYLSDQFANKAASFLSVFTAWRGQAVANDGFECIQEIVQQLLQVSSCPLESRDLVGKIATTAAIQYASITNKPRHLTWALETETRVSGMTVGSTCHTPRRILEGRLAKTHLGFRWEEGICEWVAGTPGVPKPKPIIYRDINDVASDPESVDKLNESITIDLSPSRRSCRDEISSISTPGQLQLRTKQVASDPLAKKRQGTFLGIVIHECSQTDIHISYRSPQHEFEPISPVSSDIGDDEASILQTRQDRTLHHPEQQTAPTLKMKGLVPAAKKGEKPRRFFDSSKGHTRLRGRSSRTGRVTHLVESVSSEDELSLQ